MDDGNDRIEESEEDEDAEKILDDRTSALKGKGTKRKSIDDEDEERKAERRAANRRSAFQSRQRRKILIEDLQKTVANLSKDNTELRKCNNELRMKLEIALLENQLLRKQQLSAPSAAGGGAAPTSSSVLVAAKGVAPQASVAAPAPIIGGLTGTTGAGTVAENAGNAADPLAAARLALASNQSRLNAGGLNEIVALTELGAFNQLASQQSQPVTSEQQPAGPTATVQAPATPNPSTAAAGQLQQHLAMLLTGISQGGGNATSGRITSSDIQAQQQLALFQATLAGQTGAQGHNESVTRAINALTQNITPSSENQDRAYE